MNLKTLSLPILGCLLAAPLLAQSGGNTQPVMIGLDGPDFDGCSSLGEVANLNPRGDNYLAVRARPSTSGAERDRLGPGTRVWLCDGRNDGWIGIVYGTDAQGELWDCQALGLEPRPRAYQGPCQSGWVYGSYISVIAG